MLDTAMPLTSQEPQSILLIQHDPVEAATVRGALMALSDGQFVVEWVRTCAEGLERLGERGLQGRGRANRIAAVLLDLFLPDSQGIETFDRVLKAAPQVPILALISSNHEAIARLAVERGAQDYLLKGRLDDYWLPKALRSMIERAANGDALFREKERAEVTLNSIGDAVMSTDEWCNVTYLNAIAESLTGWSRAEAQGRPIAEVFHIVDASSREKVANPMELAIRENKTMGLTPDCILIRRDGTEAAIEDSAAPIHDRRGQVTGAVMVFRDVSSARALSLRMSYLAQHDGLTDLPNRIMLGDRLSHSMALTSRHLQKLAVLFLDLDHFKHINDSLGHAIGDRLLQSVAKRLLACVRGSDTVSRQGGDEFVILLSELANARAAAVGAEKIRQSLALPHRIDDHDLYVTASIGIVIFPDDAVEAETLLKNADLAMYRAKEGGRNNFQFYTPELNVAAVQRQAIEHELRQAILRQELVLEYQPLMNLGSGAVAGVEALVRWMHPSRGLLQPEEFLSVAEESGLIVPIGRWVMREGCRQARIWQDSGLPPMRIAINVSAVELRTADFVDAVRDVLNETGLAAHNLELELTETFLMQDSSATARVLAALKGIGVQLALDDFGAGNSSLSYMTRFPIDTLKIDTAFVRDMTTDAGGAGFVNAVINLGHSLHMLVVAEGVETAEQEGMLRAQHCPEAQGFFFSNPLAATDIRSLVLGKGGQRAGLERRAIGVGAHPQAPAPLESCEPKGLPS